MVNFENYEEKVVRFFKTTKEKWSISLTSYEKKVVSFWNYEERVVRHGYFPMGHGKPAKGYERKVVSFPDATKKKWSVFAPTKKRWSVFTKNGKAA